MIDKKRLTYFAGSFLLTFLIMFGAFYFVINNKESNKSLKDNKFGGKVEKIVKNTDEYTVNANIPKTGLETIDGVINNKVTGLVSTFETGKKGVYKSLDIDYDTFTFEKDKTGVLLIEKKRSGDNKKIKTRYYPYTFNTQTQKRLTVGEALGEEKVKAISAQAYQSGLLSLEVGGSSVTEIINDFSQESIASTKRFTVDNDAIIFYSNSGSEVLPVSNKSIDIALVDSTVLNKNTPPSALTSEERIAAIDKKKPIVALTFDDGPHKILTPKLLKILKDNGAVATFFMLGTNVQRNPEVVKEMYANGNEIGSHTWKHDMLTRMTAGQIKKDLARTNRAIVKVIGDKATVFRPTYGAYNASVLKSMSEPAILWSIDPQDWKYRNAIYVAKHITDRAKDGDIILLHDIHPTSIAAAEKTVKTLKKKGYQFVTVSELAKIKGKKLKVGKRYSQIR